ncbi:MAG: hypothetical protein COB10_13010 [Planctomycetota bacterium]|nr:MAG: hypothetical protein COB10_13010 [Planctomycetota bacterium]
MSESEKAVSSDTPSDEPTTGQQLARKFIDADTSMLGVAAFCLTECFDDNAEPGYAIFKDTKEDFQADAVLGRADVLSLTREEMARTETMTTLNAYARKGWSRVLYGHSPSDPNCVKALCLAQGREFIAPKKPVSQASKDAQVRAEANMTEADRAEATAEAAAKKAAKAKTDEVRSTRDGLKTDITQIANALINAIKVGDADMVKKISPMLNRISKSAQKEVLALDKISQS